MAGFHRFLVHFPIALLAASFLFDLWAQGAGREEGRHAARYTLILGLIGALAALVTGMGAGDRLATRLMQANDPMAGRMMDVLGAHRTLALVSVASFAGLLGWRRRAGAALTGRAATVYLTIAALATGLILTTGMYGGKIAHRDRTPQPIGTHSPAPIHRGWESP